jgi:hypothetical protein
MNHGSGVISLDKGSNGVISSDKGVARGDPLDSDRRVSLNQPTSGEGAATSGDVGGDRGKILNPGP